MSDIEDGDLQSRIMSGVLACGERATTFEYIFISTTHAVPTQYSIIVFVVCTLKIVKL
jgi:hypothetical protein